MSQLCRVFSMTFAIASVAVLSACADGSSSGGDARAMQAREAKALEDQYMTVQGKWEGVVSNPASGLQPFQGELTMYIYYVQDGVNPDGSAKLRPVLRGRFLPKDFVTETDMMLLEGDYDRSGRLVLTAQKSIVTGGDLRMITVRGVIASGQATLEVTRDGGVWGTFTAVRTSTVASAPAGGERTEMRERYLRTYRQIEGSYFGILKARDGNDYNIEIAVVVFENPTSYVPELRAQYKRLDAPPGTLEWAMILDYNSQTGEVFMRESSASGGSSVPGGMLLSITGKFKTVGSQKILDVTVADRSAVRGTVEAVRSSAVPALVTVSQ